MEFKVQDKTGEVMGNRVKSKAVPFQLVWDVGMAQKAGESEKVVQTMCDVVGAYVTMEDGTPIDPMKVPQEAVIALYQFATSMESSAADFTPRP